MRGVVAAGHPLTAEAGADVLRAGGNAVDAAVACVLMSFVTESSLTGPGAGGFMLVHTAGGEDLLLDFFVAAPGKGLSDPSPAAPEPTGVECAAEAVQRFNIGPSSCGVYGTPLGLAGALDRFGTVSLADLVGPAASVAREGHELSAIQAYLVRILGPILASRPEGQAIYAPDGRFLTEGETIRFPELADLLERLGAHGPAHLYSGDVADRVSAHVLERGGLLTREDLASYRVVERAPARAHYRGVEVLTNPPPSSGGILIAYSLDLLERLARPGDLRALVEVMDTTNRTRTEEFVSGLHHEGYLERFMAVEALESAAAGGSSRLRSTTHAPGVGAAGGGAAGPPSERGGAGGVV